MPFICVYEGDCIGICTDAAGALVIEVRLITLQKSTVLDMKLCRLPRYVHPCCRHT